MVKNKYENEKGYTLLLAVLIGFLFSIIAVSLISITASGTKNNTAREDQLQATSLSEKGITHISEYINASLRARLGNDGMLQDAFIKELNDELNQLDCETGESLEISSETGDYKVCVKEYEDADMPTKKKVTFESTGMVDGVEKTSYTTVLLGATGMPDALNYALGVHCKTGKCDDFEGEGNLFLHGGVQIEGDFKVDGNIITSKKGYAYLNGEKWIDSLYPTIKPGPGSQSSKAEVVLGKEVYTFEGPPPTRVKDYANHISRTNFSNYTKATHNLESAFTHAPVITSRNPIRDEVSIEDYEELYKFNKDGADVLINSARIRDEIHEDGKVFPYPHEYRNGQCLRWEYVWFIPVRCIEYEKIEVPIHVNQFEMYGENAFKNFATDKPLHIYAPNQNSKTEITIGKHNEGSYQGGMYIGGDLTIGNTSITEDDPSKFQDISISGNIFVDGDLTIWGANVDFNSIIYVTGDVEVQYSTINGMKNEDGTRGTLILFADGQIYFANNSVNQDDPSNITGYFYSNDKFEMFGVGSNIRIEGGISARRVVLNAIRGRAKNNRFDGSQRITNNRYFEGVEGQAKRDSRLQVIYNPGVVGTYSELQLEAPIVRNVDKPEIISRE